MGSSRVRRVNMYAAAGRAVRLVASTVRRMRPPYEVFVLVRRDDEYLILHRSPRQGAYWHCVAGGVEEGETYAEAAVRELREETGLSARPRDLGDPVWHEVAEFSYDGRRYRQEQDFFLLRVGSPEISADGRDDEEAAVIDGHRWWTLSELEATTDSYYPPELPGLLRALS